MQHAHTFNQVGVAEIRGFLAEFHKLRGKDFTPDMLAAWVRAAEAKLEAGLSPVIEIRSRDSISGYNESITVSDEGIDSKDLPCTA